jgi:hypothetical protein
MRIRIGLFLLLFLMAAVAQAADLTGNWVGEKGAPYTCDATTCKLAKGKAAGYVILKDIQITDTKGTAKMQAKKDQWMDVTVETTGQELTLTGPKGHKFTWKRAQ